MRWEVTEEVDSSRVERGGGGGVVGGGEVGGEDGGEECETGEERGTEVQAIKVVQEMLGVDCV